MIRDQEIMQLLLDSIRIFVKEVLIPREEEVAETDAASLRTSTVKDGVLHRDELTSR